MADERSAASDEPAQVSAGEAARIARLAFLDDRLGGHVGGVTGGRDTGGRDGDDTLDAGAADAPDLAAAVDTILLLRQVAAAEGARHEEPLVLPQRIGRYEILREAGRGAFAHVLEARDEILHRRVALKVARPEALVSVPFRRRFVREAELAARLIHPHIVAIHEVGEEAGFVFIASEYCAGGDLAAWLERHPGPLPPGEAAELVRALATAVAHAHAAGIVHRDIKPANVLLVPRAATPVAPGAAPAIADMAVKLGDFGLGKLFQDHEAEELTQLTRTGSRLGTPAWMAPEQIDRSFGEVGPATDVHALGLLLDRLLTGRCLFGGKTEAEIFRAVLLDEPVGADRVVRRVPRALAAVCLACLAKRPADRYASAADLAADLSRFLADEPTVARPQSAASRVARTVARRPLLSLLAVAAVGGVLLAGWTIRERGRDTQKIVAGREEISRLEAATELRRGFEAWRTGNAVAAVDHLRASAAVDRGLADSFAGRWLLARLHGEHDTLLAPADPPPARPDLYCFSFSRDGRTLAAGGADGRLHILGLTADGGVAGPPLAIAAHDEVNDVAFSPDGLQVASAGEDGRLCVWSVADGGLARDAYQAQGPLFAAAFSPAGDRIVCGGAQQRLCLIPTGAGEEPVEWRPLAEAVAAGSLADDADVESLLFIAADEIAVACGGVVAVVALSGGDPAGSGVRLLTGHDGTVGQVALSPDGRRLLSGGTDREPRVWDLDTARLLFALPRHPGWVQGCDFSPDGRTIASGCRDGVVRVFDAATGSEERKLVGHLGRTWDVKYAPGGMVTSAGADGTLRRWGLAAAADALGMREVRVPGPILGSAFERGQRRVARIVESPSGTRMILMSLPGRIVLVDPRDGGVAIVPAPASHGVYTIAVDHRRGRVASMPVRGGVEVVSLSPPSSGDGPEATPSVAVRGLPWGDAGRGKDADWTPSGMLFAGCDHGRLLAWEAALDRVIEVDRFERTVDAVRVAPAGAARLAIAAGKLVRVYPLPASGPPRAAAAKTVVTLGAEAGVVVKLAWSPDALRLAYGTSEGRVEIIDAAGGRSIVVLPRHAREVAGIAWSPDGRTLVTADAECVRFTDVATATTIDELRPGWTIEGLDSVGDAAGPNAAGTGPLVVVAGSAPVAATVADREARLGILDLHRSLPPPPPSPAAQP